MGIKPDGWPGQAECKLRHRKEYCFLRNFGLKVMLLKILPTLGLVLVQATVRGKIL